MAKDYSKLGEYEERFGMDFALAFYDQIPQCKYPAILERVHQEYISGKSKISTPGISHDDYNKENAALIEKCAQMILTPPQRTAQEYDALEKQYAAGEYSEYFVKDLQAIRQVGMSPQETEQKIRELINEWPERVRGAKNYEIIQANRSPDMNVRTSS